jgi:hypothetical protein
MSSTNLGCFFASDMYNPLKPTPLVGTGTSKMAPLLILLAPEGVRAGVGAEPKTIFSNLSFFDTVSKTSFQTVGSWVEKVERLGRVERAWEKRVMGPGDVGDVGDVGDAVAGRAGKSIGPNPTGLASASSEETLKGM